MWSDPLTGAHPPVCYFKDWRVEEPPMFWGHTINLVLFSDGCRSFVEGMISELRENCNSRLLGWRHILVEAVFRRVDLLFPLNL